MKIPALFGLVALNISGSVAAQDMSVPADPVAAIEGDWKGIWHEWEVRVTDGRVVLTKGDPKSYSWLPVGTVLGVLNNNGKSEPRMFRFSGSTCLDHRRDLPPSAYKAIPCGDYSATLGVFADSYELRVSGISLRRPKNASGKQAGDKPKTPAAQSQTYHIRQGDTWTVCESGFYVPRAANAPRAGETARYFWSRPFKSEGPIRYVYKRQKTYLNDELEDGYKQFLADSLGLDPTYIAMMECNFYPSEEEALSAAHGEMRNMSGGVRSIEAAPPKALLVKEARAAQGLDPEDGTTAPNSASKAGDAKPTGEATSKGSSAAELAAERHAAVEQRNREKQAKYEADMKAWQDQIDAQKAEEERKKARLEADKQLAAQKLAAFESEQEAHRQEMEKAAEQLRKYQDAQRHHALCTAGDRSACEALAKLQTAGAAVAKDAGEASTDDDARQCVTEPVLSPSEVWKGALKAVVVNGCAKPVDVRICLMRTGGWNCGMMLGLKPQEDWTWWTMNPQEGVFWDARTSGTNRKLASPAG